MIKSTISLVFVVVIFASGSVTGWKARALYEAVPSLKPIAELLINR